jgi:hypothetical protein
LGTINILQNFFSIGFEGDFNFFLLELNRGFSAKFSIQEEKEKYAPMLTDPTKSANRKNLILYLLLHGGFLTEDCRKGKNYIIPNLELVSLFEEQLQEYLTKFPIEQMRLTTLAKALKDEDFKELGEEVMRSLKEHSLKYTVKEFLNETHSEKEVKNKDPNFQSELYIHNLMWKVFSHETLNTPFHAVHERGSKESNYDSKKGKGNKTNSGRVDSNSTQPNDTSNKDKKKPKTKSQKDKAKNKEELKKMNPGYFIDFLISPKWATDKVHYALELKIELKGKEEGLLHYSLFGLRQIFQRDYHRDIKPFQDTEAIVSIGVAANTTHASFSILKIPVLGGNYGRQGKLICQSFYIPKKPDDNITVKHTEQKEFMLDIFYANNATGGKGRTGYAFNDDIRDGIAQQLTVKITQASKIVDSFSPSQLELLIEEEEKAKSSKFKDPTITQN